MLMPEQHRGLARMPIRKKRATSLLLSLLLPVLAVATLALFTIGAVMLSANDRAIVWADGTPGQLAQMQRQVSANPWFRHGRSEAAGADRPLPAGCGATAREFSFGSLGEFETQAAREILELMASRAGARICLTNVFIINELPDRARQSWLQAFAHTLLAASVLPLALVLSAYLAMSGRLKLAPLLASGRNGAAASLAWGIGLGFCASLLLALVHWLGAGAQNPAQATAAMTVANVGYPLAFTLVMAVPVIEEVAFRGWMIPLAERGIGTLPAAGASSALYAAASLPADAWSAAGYLLLGMACAAVYLRTRSVPACIVANVMVSATSFWLA
jgi:membrane protease YdiL (CAAX protease family)